LRRIKYAAPTVRSWKRNGAPEEIRTPDPQIRSLVLYPAELRVRVAAVITACVAIL
jgi:hypothetical protein